MNLQKAQAEWLRAEAEKARADILEAARDHLRARLHLQIETLNQTAVEMRHLSTLAIEHGIASLEVMARLKADFCATVAADLLAVLTEQVEEKTDDDDHSFGTHIKEAIDAFRNPPRGVGLWCAFCGHAAHEAGDCNGADRMDPSMPCPCSGDRRSESHS